VPASTAPGVRLLPNAVTVLALCSGLSGVQFMLTDNHVAAIAAIALAGVFDALDGRLARLLDATSRIGAELDSLSDCISFGVSPALILFLWQLHDLRVGWVVALVLVVSTALRLARFNTLSDDEEAPPFAGEFFVGVPSPAGALVALTPLATELLLGPGWWSAPVTVAIWTVFSAGLMISRIPTSSLKSVRVPPAAVAPALVLVALAAAAVVAVPFALYPVAILLYLAHIPYAIYRYRWLERHPEVWHVPPRQRRAVRRAHRRLGLLPPRRPLPRRVAGAAARAGRRTMNRERVGDRPPGSRRLGVSGARRRAQERRGPDRPHGERPGSERPGSERPGSERPGPERPQDRP
jgi:CDP-diacylglycerol--serine O-phosphatidyltransferase